MIYSQPIGQALSVFAFNETEIVSEKVQPLLGFQLMFVLLVVG
jgi:hypothetical protein